MNPRLAPLLALLLLAGCIELPYAPQPNARDAGDDLFGADADLDTRTDADPDGTDTSSDAGERPLPRIMWARIPAGAFDMGSLEGEPGHDDVETLHHVTLTQAFEMMTTEMTQGYYEALTGVAPNEACGLDCPVVDVTWVDAIRAANRLSVRMGLMPCYDVGDAEVPHVTWFGPLCEGYRLPTEAEWEYAARAGSTTALPNGRLELGGGNCADDDSGNLDAIAWYCNNAPDETSSVHRLQPNRWGLHDILGNAREWVWDSFRPYTGAPVVDPVGSLVVSCAPLVPSAECERVTRGGHFQSDADECRSASRESRGLAQADRKTSFRLVRTLPNE